MIFLRRGASEFGRVMLRECLLMGVEALVEDFDGEVLRSELLDG